MDDNYSQRWHNVRQRWRYPRQGERTDRDRRLQSLAGATGSTSASICASVWAYGFPRVLAAVCRAPSGLTAAEGPARTCLASCRSCSPPPCDWRVAKHRALDVLRLFSFRACFRRLGRGPGAGWLERVGPRQRAGFVLGHVLVRRSRFSERSASYIHQALVVVAGFRRHLAASGWALGYISSPVSTLVKWFPPTAAAMATGMGPSWALAAAP